MPGCRSRSAACSSGRRGSSLAGSACPLAGGELEIDGLQLVERPQLIEQLARHAVAEDGHRELEKLVVQLVVGQGQLGVALAVGLEMRNLAAVVGLDVDLRRALVRIALR